MLKQVFRSLQMSVCIYIYYIYVSYIYISYIYIYILTHHSHHERGVSNCCVCVDRQAILKQPLHSLRLPHRALQCQYVCVCVCVCVYYIYII